MIAHDFGGAVSLRTHLTLGVAYASLMLVDPVAIPLVGSPFFRFVKEHPAVLTELPGFIHESVVPSYIRGGSHPGLTDRELATLTAPWLEETGQMAFYHQIADFDEAYLEEIQRGCSAIDIPVQILWGEQDAWIPRRIRATPGKADPRSGFRAHPRRWTSRPARRPDRSRRPYPSLAHRRSAHCRTEMSFLDEPQGHRQDASRALTSAITNDGV